MKSAEVYSKHNNARISPKKMAIVMDIVRGMDLHDAKVALTFDSSKAAKMLLKVVKSAEANAVNNQNLNPEVLFLSEVKVDGATPFKRWRADSKSRVAPILKRNSHITVGLSQKEDTNLSKESK